MNNNVLVIVSIAILGGAALLGILVGRKEKRTPSFTANVNFYGTQKESEQIQRDNTVIVRDMDVNDIISTGVKIVCTEKYVVPLLGGDLYDKSCCYKQQTNSSS